MQQARKKIPQNLSRILRFAYTTPTTAQATPTQRADIPKKRPQRRINSGERDQLQKVITAVGLTVAVGAIGTFAYLGIALDLTNQDYTRQSIWA